MTAPAAAARPPTPTLRIYIIAGEPSGDRLGADLMRAIRQRVGDVSFSGVGASAMQAEGLASLFPMSDIAVMGFAPVIRRLPLILKRIGETAEAVRAARPDVLVIVDSPDFTHRVARTLRRHAPQIPIVDYVSPTVWAWRPGRAKAMRAYVDHVLAVLPFEPEAHRRLGGPLCTYVGHPLVERLDVLRPNAQEALARERPSLLVLPGSRRSEIRRLTPIFGDAVARIVERLGAIDLVVPAVEDHRAEIEALVGRWAVVPRIVTGEPAKLAAFRSARAAIAASGTVTLELALSGVPMVVAYRVAALEVWLKYIVTVQTMVLPNLILGRNAIPEFFQDDCTGDALAAAVLPLLVGGAERQDQLAAFAEVDRLMRLDGGLRPSEKAAEAVLGTMPHHFG